MSLLRLEIVTPTGRVMDAQVSSVVAPGAEGEFAVLPDHRPGIVLLGGGAIKFEGPTSGSVLIRGGVAEIGPDHVLVLADEAVKPEAADSAAAQASLDKLQVEMASAPFLTDEALLHFAAERQYNEAILSRGR